ncbi:DUF3379 family protein [Inmirania thermothiophila]|uniref:Uncharacterized protein DUF3379 n=1 Tax=Inmirania thermothiophila TaxID=1750597 RepID=A0A3N1Y772_9GAMM|nr:DUF3379 family protein [Inmirania thermothiophila]ROR34625.1 uncharacterized protein DUF3379 [Inmirania thermothiophila]
MNAVPPISCLEFRRRILVDPRDRDPALSAHRRDCPGCRSEAERIERLEAALHEACKVPVPEGLSARILLRQSLREEGRPRARRQRWLQVYALAASVLLVAGILGGGYYLQQSREAPVEHMVAATVGERMAEIMRVAAGTEADDQVVRNMFREIGAQLVGDLGPVAYCEVTRLQGRKAGMLVFRGARGPVTVVYLMGEQVPRREPIRHDGLEGVIWPEGKGSVAVLGPAGESLAPYEERLRRAVRWY